jgi:hypothetical protein
MNRQSRRQLLLALILAAGILVPGCVERTMIIRSDPPGADLMVDGAEVGETPVTIPFLNYGTHQFILAAEGHQRRKLLQPVDAPGYETFPIDFFVEMLWPWTVRDIHVFGPGGLYTLEPVKDVDKAGLSARGEDLRKRSTEMGAAE